MRQARMPGFTADAGLTAAARAYAPRGRTAVAGDAIAPQGLIALPGSTGMRRGGIPCDPTCVCITAEGCPCCESFLPRMLPSRRHGRFL